MPNSIHKIALVDDDRIFHHLTIKNLDVIPSARILSFYDGQEALSHLRENVANLELIPTIMFLDINMPMMDGWMLLEELESTIPELLDKIHIHILTSSINREDYARALAHPRVISYISKPLTAEKMEVVLNPTE